MDNHLIAVFYFFFGLIMGIVVSNIDAWVLSWKNRKRKPKPSKYPLILKSDFIVIRLNMHDHHRLAMWACLLNGWQWPLDLRPEEPVPISSGSYIPGRRSQLRNYLEDIVGEKMVSLVWNTEYCQKWTKEQFEEWWSENHDK